MADEDDYIMLSGLQHFSYCRRQWALIHIENQWQENLLTTQGMIMHQNAHDSDSEEMRGNKLIVRGMHVKSDILKVTGVCDIVEFKRNEHGISIYGRDGLWEVNPVEYKRGKSKENDCDRLQLCGQALCLEEMLCCRISSGDLFYGEPHRREHVPITDELRQKTIKMLKEMRELYEKRYTPKVKYKKGCEHCSLKDICLPQMQYRSVRGYMDEMLDEEAGG